MRAAANTPAERVGACVARFPTRSSLPRVAGGSASASQVSGPARRSLALRPAWSLSRPRRPLSSECFGRYRCLHRPLRLLPAGATVAGRDSHPLRDDAFHGAPPQAAKLNGLGSGRGSLARGRGWLERFCSVPPTARRGAGSSIAPAGSSGTATSSCCGTPGDATSRRARSPSITTSTRRTASTPSSGSPRCLTRPATSACSAPPAAPTPRPTRPR